MKTNIEYRQQFQSKEVAASYDAQYAEDGYARLLYQLEKERLQEIIAAMRQTHPRIETLDFACGTGRITAFLETIVDKSVGIDISSSMLERASINTTQTELICGDLTTEPSLCPGPFDLVVTFRFVTNAEPELREAAFLRLRERLRDKDSRIIFNVHRSLSSYLFLHWLVQKARRITPDHDWKYMSISEARGLARRCGLEFERVNGFGFLSSYIAKHLPYKFALNIERTLGRIPGLSLLGSEFIAVCRPA